MRETEIAVIGGGPAGLCAAIAAASLGASVTVIDRADRLGGQLVKQTHKFFGSEGQRAGVRGIAIARELAEQLARYPRATVMLDATVLGYYRDDGVLGIEQGGRFTRLKPWRLICATGAAERMLAFPNNDLPGVYGAGAVQTLMNVHGVIPGKEVLMVGSGNIGLIVSYQLAQAGVSVKAVVEAAPQVGGYWVHAAKISRLGIPIYLAHTVKEAHGTEHVEGATIWQVDESWQPKPGTEVFLEVDAICLAVGLSPLVELLWQAGCELKYQPELGGHVPVRGAEMETTVPGIYVAGDAAGVEEASTAMLEGEIAGLAAARSLGYWNATAAQRTAAACQALAALRRGPVSEKVIRGLRAVLKEEDAAC